MSLGIAVLTVSDTRTLDDDKSGNLLVERIAADGHRLAARLIKSDDRYGIRAQLSNWLIDEAVDVIIITGGTGLTGRDLVPEAVRPLLDRITDGFGELFRMLSYADVGTSAIQSRAFAGSANGRLVFCLPGSRGACELAWDKIIGLQLNTSTRPCNLVDIIPRMKESPDEPAAKRPSNRD
ncbi:molybdenum cofactor biosynthesis protein B [uncultured Nevskia sp.]|uniref:molybdenum cofactor biosynthesis protein B n=1 Tax=uncultured Nevskia sp. TaxID=228950 RepID=UPI0025DB7752|nr:molybdenum cofactor biosynthesis protein B [uncultured Nevskia sp.]